MTSTRVLRKNPPKLHANLAFDYKEDDGEIPEDSINPAKKRKFEQFTSKLPKDIKDKMYMIVVYLYDIDEKKIKIGYTRDNLSKRLDSLNGQYKSGYDIELLGWFYVNHENDETDFHKQNIDILDNYTRPFGQKDREIYPRNSTVTERFFIYEDSINIK
jgi:hypothetical protein